MHGYYPSPEGPRHADTGRLTDKTILEHWRAAFRFLAQKPCEHHAANGTVDQDCPCGPCTAKAALRLEA